MIIICVSVWYQSCLIFGIGIYNKKCYYVGFFVHKSLKQILLITAITLTCNSYVIILRFNRSISTSHLAYYPSSFGTLTNATFLKLKKISRKFTLLWTIPSKRSALKIFSLTSPTFADNFLMLVRTSKFNDQSAARTFTRLPNKILLEMTFLNRILLSFVRGINFLFFFFSFNNLKFSVQTEANKCIVLLRT